MTNYHCIGLGFKAWLDDLNSIFDIVAGFTNILSLVELLLIFRRKKNGDRDGHIIYTSGGSELLDDSNKFIALKFPFQFCLCLF